MNDKYQRVANFHAATLKNCRDLMGAMGITHVNELTPHHIYHRLDSATSKTYGELYEFLQPNALLQESLPENFAQAWRDANPQQF